MADTDDGRRNRLYWQCRRGMRELDLLLQGFLKARYDELEEHQRSTFEHLLTYPDAILLEWLMGRQIPADKDVAQLVNTIRNADAS